MDKFKNVINMASRDCGCHAAVGSHYLTGKRGCCKNNIPLKSLSFYHSVSGFSTSAMAAFLIGILQFLLLPNSTITSSSVISITTP